MTSSEEGGAITDRPNWHFHGIRVKNAFRLANSLMKQG